MLKHMGANDIVKLSINKRKSTAIIINNRFIGLQRRGIPALAGGFITILLFGGWLKLCAMLQVGIAKYSALYGGFAVVPILLMWVYMSWQIILLGAEIVFAVQNRDTYVLEQHASEASLRSRLLLALTLCSETARLARDKDGGPFAAEAFAKQHGIPSRFVKEVLDGLVRNQVLAEVAERPGEYLLYRCASSITVAEVTKILMDDGEPPEQRHELHGETTGGRGRRPHPVYWRRTR